jgi:hypothetical protein
MKSSQPLNIFVGWSLGACDGKTHHDYEQTPNAEKIVGERQTEDVKKRPVEEQRPDQKEKRP